MTHGSHAEQTHAPVPVPQETPRAAVTGKARSVLLGRLAIVREMIATMESVTNAGQRNVMAKIVAFFEDVVANRCAGANGRARFLLAHLLHELAHESRRLLPHVRSFQDHATDLLRVLAEVV